MTDSGDSNRGKTNNAPANTGPPPKDTVKPISAEPVIPEGTAILESAVESPNEQSGDS